MNIGTKISAPISVNLELTDQCNLGCFFCFSSRNISSQQYPTLSSEERYENLVQILHFLKEAGVLEVRFFGGEFSLVRNWRQLMEYAHKLGFFISFVSNGTLFHNEDVALFKQVGITECSISLHGKRDVHDQVTKRPGSFDKAVGFIKALQREHIDVAVPFTPTPVNLPFFEEFVVLMSRDHHIETIGMNRLYKDDGSYGQLSLSDYIDIFKLLHKIRVKYNIPVNFLDSFPRCLVPMRYWPYMMYCAQGIAFAQVNAFGDVKNCSSVHVSLGNLFQQDMKSIWDIELRDFRKLNHLPLSCRLCPIYCGGGCIATRTMESNFVPDEFISMPEEESLIEAIKITAKNYLKKWLFQSLSFIRHQDNSHIQQEIPECPIMKRKYRLRKEDENSYIGLFDNRGILFLDQDAVDILRMLNGSNSLQDISKKKKYVHNKG